MTSERWKRRIEVLLDEADAAIRSDSWVIARQRAQTVLDLDPENPDAPMLLAAADRALVRVAEASPARPSRQITHESGKTIPSAFVDGRYKVKRLLGEGGKKRVYLAHDTHLDRDVAFALIKAEGLGEAGQERVTREAQAMGRLGDHPNIVSVYDVGQTDGQYHMVLPLLPGGDLGSLIERAPEHRLPIDRVIKLAVEISQGLEFAHAKGVIHRDLKPGNIWLTADERAQIGDFGLAVAIDKARLTQTGVMVGTASYMPPEQALGGQVTPRSDLYSLGAVLYEMVCGRPPFVGEESLAIVSQHLNTPPVAPSWHRSDLPRALEELILSLLEKDPDRRPSNAAAVIETLLSISETSEASLASPRLARRDPLYRRAFVGRAAELHQLQQAFDAAISGEGGLVMISGEPGIGKTALCEQVTTYATLRGGKALFGHCQEEGEYSLPYLPFVEAMRSYVLTREPEALRSELGSGASEVARIVSEVRSRIDVQPSEASNPIEQRWRLMQAVTSFLHNATTLQPIIIVLEDLHDADKGTLDLLTYLARNLNGTRLLVVGTYRDVDVGRTHPFSSALAELRRGTNFLRIQLRGLQKDEVQGMIDAIPGLEESPDDAETLHQHTEGNPLFVQEVLRYLVEAGLVTGAGRVAAVSSLLSDLIPEGLRDTVGKRLSRLSTTANQVLSIASVIGRDFELDLLRSVAGLPEDELLLALEEAADRALIEQQKTTRGVTFRFTHAFFRVALYQEIFAPRRMALHRQVGRAMIQHYIARLDDYTTQIAEHLAQSSDPLDLVDAGRFWESAARRSLSVFAFGEAARFADQALVTQGLTGEDPSRRCDLLLLVGEALRQGGEERRAIEEIAPQAFDLADSLGDGDRCWRAAYIACYSIGAIHERTGTVSAGVVQWFQRLDRYATLGTEARVRADLWLGHLAWATGNTSRAWVMYNRSLEGARNAGNPALVLEAAAPILLGNATPPEAIEGRCNLAEELLEHYSDAVQATTSTGSLSGLAMTFLTDGQRGRTDIFVDRIREVAARAPAAANQFSVLFSEAVVAAVDGRFEATFECGEGIRSLAKSLGRERFGEDYASSMNRRPLILLGRAGEAIEQLPASRDLLGTGDALGAQRAVCLAFSGRLTEAQSLLSQIVAQRNVSDHEVSLSAGVLCMLLEIATILGDTDKIKLILPRLEPVTRFLHGDASGLQCIGRLVGDARLVLRQYAAALEAYAAGLQTCAAARFRPEAALCRLGMATALEAIAKDTPAVADQLSLAIPEFEGMKMQPALERALKLQAKLESASGRAVYPDGLSEREIEVLRLLAHAKSNQEIGETLFIALNTVARHVSNIFAKTGATNRTEAAVYAHHHSIV